MPKVEIDYSNTIIYKITCNDSNVTDKYVGHTTNFVQRKYAHKDGCTNEKSSNHKCKLYEKIRQHGGWSNWKMEIINFFNCKDHYEARQKEQEYFELLNANLNSIEPLPKLKSIPIPIPIPIPIEIIDKNVNPQQKICETCNYSTSSIKDFNKHISTQKHKRLTETNKNPPKIPEQQIYSCLCNKKYQHQSSLCKHKKTCCFGSETNETNETNENNEINVGTSLSSIIDKDELIKYLIKENSEFKDMLMEQNKMVMKICEKSVENAKTINNTNCNNVNNSFNLNLFLNEKCKDAINIDEFVDNIKMQLLDLENFGNLGYVQGVSRILIKNLNELDTYSRPIHCSDLKRDVLYIKENNQWTKETDDKPLLKNAIKQVTNKNIKQIQDWKNLNPDCTKSDSRKNDQYLKIIMNSMSGGTSEEQQNNISQIVKNVVKVVTIDKNTEK